MADLVKVDFHGDALWATRQDGEVFVAVKPVCEGMGIVWEAQRQRIRRDSILSEGAIMIMAPSRGGFQDALCLPLRLLNGWLFGIDERRVKRADVRDKIIAYKRECHAVLFEHFMPKARPEPDEPEAVESEWDRWLQLIREGRRTFGQRFARELWSRPDCPLPRPSVESVRDRSVAGFIMELPGLPDSFAGEDWIGATDLYRTYRDWCGQRGFDPATQTTFGRALVKAGAWKEQRDGRLFYAKSGLGFGTPKALN